MRGCLSGGGPFSALPGHLETAERHGRRAYMTVQDAHRRRRTRENGRGGIDTLSRRWTRSRGLWRLQGAAGFRKSQGMRPAAHPLEVTDGGYRAVRLCEALHGAFTLRVI